MKTLKSAALTTLAAVLLTVPVAYAKGTVSIVKPAPIVVNDPCAGC